MNIYGILIVIIGCVISFIGGFILNPFMIAFGMILGGIGGYLSVN